MILFKPLLLDIEIITSGNNRSKKNLSKIFDALVEGQHFPFIKKTKESDGDLIKRICLNYKCSKKKAEEKIESTIKDIKKRSIIIKGRGWKTMKTAPLNATKVTVILIDNTIHKEAHWASDLSGEEQPPFQGWFIKNKGFNGYTEIETPIAWKPIAMEEDNPTVKERLHKVADELTESVLKDRDKEVSDENP